MMIDMKTIALFHSKLDEIMKKLETSYGRKFPRPSLKFRQMGKTAGRAFYMTNDIELNSDFCKNGNLENMLNQTLPHEVAHVISFQRWGILYGKGHGAGWKNVMRVLGVDPKRCHNYNLDGVKVRTRKQYNVACKCRTHLISSVIFNRMNRGVVYKCKFCRVGLSLVNKV